MKINSDYRTNRYYIAIFCLCLCINLVACFIRQGLLPHILEYSKTHLEYRWLIFAGICILIIAVVICSLGMMTRLTQIYTPEIRASRDEHIKRTAAVFGLSVTCVLIFSLISGAASAAIYTLLKHSLSYEQIKLCIDVATGIAALLMLPVVVIEAISVLLNPGGLKDSLSEGLPVVRDKYIKTLVVVLAAVIFAVITGFVRVEIVKVIMDVMVGSIATAGIYVLVADE